MVVVVGPVGTVVAVPEFPAWPGLDGVETISDVPATSSWTVEPLRPGSATIVTGPRSSAFSVCADWSPAGP